MADKIVISVNEAKKLIGEEATEKLVDFIESHADILQFAVDRFTELLWPAVTALAAVGILSMALLEIWKTLWHARRKFQQKNFETWIRDVARRTGRDGERALTNLIDLATAGNADALYDLPVERFSGQINAAVQIALAYPDKYSDVVGILAHKAEQSDIDIIVGPRPEANDKEGKQTYADARNRVGNLTQRSLDAIQIDIGERWARGLHIRSVIVSSVLILIAAILSYQDASPVSASGGSETSASGGSETSAPGGSEILDVIMSDPGGFVIWVVIAIVGGMVAPVARDLVSALKTVRDRQR